MAAAVWTDRGRRAVTALGTVTRSKSSHTALKSQYDALVIGGGEMCELLGGSAENTGAVLQCNNPPNFAKLMQRFS